jgi:hypothetical protein
MRTYNLTLPLQMKIVITIVDFLDIIHCPVIV